MVKNHKGKNLNGIEAKDNDYFEQAFGINRTGFPRQALLDKNGVLGNSSAPSPVVKQLSN